MEDQEKPTELQRRLAEKLQVENAATMTKNQLSRTFSKMLYDQEGVGSDEKVERAIESAKPKCEYALTLYKKGSKYFIDALEFADTQYDEKNRIFVECIIPVIDRTDGPDHLVPEWDDKYINLTMLGMARRRRVRQFERKKASPVKFMHRRGLSSLTCCIRIPTWRTAARSHAGSERTQTH